MSEKRHIQWLLNELPGLRTQGVLSIEAENALRTHYESRISDSRSYFPLALAILGLALIAGGIVLIFNYNWDQMSLKGQIAVSFLPLALGLVVSLYTLIGSRSQLWREASAILTAAGGATAVALLSRIFQLHGSLADYMTLVLLNALPLIFIFDSIGLATLCTFGMFPLIEFGIAPAPNPVRSLILTGILIYQFLHLRNGGRYRIYTRYLVIPAMLYTCIQYSSSCPMLMLFSMAGFFLLLSCNSADEGDSFWKNPWFPISFVLMTVLLAISTESSRPFRIPAGMSSEQLFCFWIPEGLLLAGTAGLIFRNIRQKRRDIYRIMIPVMMILVLAGYLICTETPPQNHLFFRIAMNCFMGAFGISLLAVGARTRSLLVFNEGMLLCSVLFVLRFLSADIGLVIRGIGMILAGLVIIGANLYLLRRIRSGKEVCHETK